MNEKLEQLKIKNKQTIKTTSKTLLYIISGLLILSIVLLLIDNDLYLTPAVLMIFFSFVLGIIALFLTAINKMRNYQIKLKNNIEIIYQSIVEQFNLLNGTTYSCLSENDSNEEWLLVPSYATNEVNYQLSDSKVRLYDASSFNIVGAEQRRTYYFTGLYILTDGPEGDFQYWSNTSVSDKIINMLKGIYGEDQNDIKHYSKKVPLNGGTLHSDSDEIPLVIEEVINSLLHIENVKDYKIGVRNNKLHIAINLKNNRLPIIKKYNEEEYQVIQKQIYEYLNLLEKIKQI